jgi:hypothetical protein
MRLAGAPVVPIVTNVPLAGTKRRNVLLFTVLQGKSTDPAGLSPLRQIMGAVVGRRPVGTRVPSTLNPPSRRLLSNKQGMQKNCDDLTWRRVSDRLNSEYSRVPLWIGPTDLSPQMHGKKGAK